MKNTKTIFFLLSFFIVFITAFNAFSQSSTSNQPQSTPQLTEQELILYNLINDLRQEHRLPVLPISDKLCLVGRTHISDLEKNYKPDEGCSLHSWSEKGKWNPCCHSKDPSGIACMRTKPKEIAGYPGFGYELIYWGNEKANALDAYNLWRETKASLDMILCTGKWKSFSWKTIGVSVSSNYAIIWFGDQLEKTDILPPKTSIADTPKLNQVQDQKKNEPITTTVESKPSQDVSVSETKNRYFLIVASLKSEQAAKTTLKKYKSSGYPKAQIIDGGSMQRIAIKGFVKEADAQAELNKLREKHPGIWILHK